MKKIRKVLQPDSKSRLFSAGVDYFSVPNESLWGAGEMETLELLEQINVTGNWLDLASGDGRYALVLSKKVRNLFVADADPGALSKLFYRIDSDSRNVLLFTQLNIIDSLPYFSNSFDGILCTGTLHLFTNDILAKVLVEILRTLKTGGTFIMDFAVDIERKYPDGTSYSYIGDQGYSTQEANSTLRNILGNNLDEIMESSFEDDLTGIDGYGYITRGKFLLILATKKERSK